MPEVTHDAAAAYVTAKGVIRASNDSSAWIDTFKGDIVSFLVSLSTQAGGLFGSTNIAAGGSTISLTTSSRATNFRMVTEYDASNNCKILLKWMSDNSHILLDNFALGYKHPIYWLVLKGIAASTSDASAFAPDIMVIMARDESITLTGEVSSYSAPTETEWADTIIDNMCKYTPASFIFASGLNSLTNTQNECCVIALEDEGRRSNAITWETSESMEHGYHIVENEYSGSRINTYRTDTRSGFDGSYLNSIMITADTVYYPPKSMGTVSTSGHPFMQISQASSINYISPMWSQSSACITTNTKCIVWGGYLDLQTPHEGPELVNLGDSGSPNYHLRCYDLFMPVANPSSGDDDND